jgi:hypothetical protein
MFPSPIDLTVPDPPGQVGIVSRIAPAVASEGSLAARDANKNETCRKRLLTSHSPSISGVLVEPP